MNTDEVIKSFKKVSLLICDCFFLEIGLLFKVALVVKKMVSKNAIAIIE